MTGMKKKLVFVNSVVNYPWRWLATQDHAKLVYYSTVDPLMTCLEFGCIEKRPCWSSSSMQTVLCPPQHSIYLHVWQDGGLFGSNSDGNHRAIKNIRHAPILSIVVWLPSSISHTGLGVWLRAILSDDTQLTGTPLCWTGRLSKSAWLLGTPDPIAAHQGSKHAPQRSQTLSSSGPHTTDNSNPIPMPMVCRWTSTYNHWTSRWSVISNLVWFIFSMRRRTAQPEIRSLVTVLWIPLTQPFDRGKTKSANFTKNGNCFEEHNVLGNGKCELSAI